MTRALVLVVLCGCAEARAGIPCETPMRNLVGAHAERIHGLTENDDVREGMERIQRAAVCADGPALVTVRAHARLMRHRLASRGGADELLNLARVLEATQKAALVEEAAAIRSEVKRSAEAARERLIRAAARLAGDASWEPWRIELAGEAWDPERKPSLPTTTAAYVTHAGPQRSCFSVLPGADLKSGMATFSLVRGTRSIALHGDSPVQQLREDRRPRVVTLCAAELVEDGDTVRVVVGDAPAFSQPLAVPQTARLRGALVEALARGNGCTPPFSSTPEADACAWAQGANP